MLELEGVVEDIIYRNDENSYTVARLETEDGLITIVGYMPFVNVDEAIKVTGDMVYHMDYGEQFKLENMEILMPSTLVGIERYLSSGMIPYIGPKTAKKIVERFGMESLTRIQEDPNCLLEIEGIGQKKIEKISKAFEEQSEARNVMVFLQQYGITANYSMKIYRAYGNETIGIIRENPYRLSEDIYGIGFKMADKIAQNMGIERDSAHRIEGGIKYTLSSSAQEGHVYLPKEELLKNAREILGLDPILIDNQLLDLHRKGSIVIKLVDGESLVYSSLLYKAEQEVARKLTDIGLAETKSLELDLDREIERLEKLDNIVFGKKQREAIGESVRKGFLVITGGPGTGKTTTINSIISILEDQGLSVTLAAPTGRAAKRMTETTGREAKTIHRLLEYSFMEEGDFAFGIDESNPLETDVLIIDEASMIDILLMRSLLKAVSTNTRLILVGDVDQLPSVGPGNVLKDIIESQAMEVVVLDEIFRQAEESMIVVNAHRINKGDFPFLNLKDKDFFFIEEKDPEKINQVIMDLCKTRLPKFYGLDPIEDIQVLSPMKKGDVGVNSLNKNLQKVLNKEGLLKAEKNYGETVFRENDKVMQIKNNYSVPWEIRLEGYLEEKGEGIYNGDFGSIEEVDHEGSYMKILFDGEKEVDYSFSDLDELQLAYATTVHKSQGSEFPVIVMPISWGPPMLLTRNLLYTAITRAKKLVVLVGDPKYLAMMIRNNRITRRYSALDRNLKEALKILKED